MTAGRERIATCANLFSFDDRYAQEPVGAVLPDCTEEVQAIVRTVNRYGVSLWPEGRIGA